MRRSFSLTAILTMFGALAVSVQVARPTAGRSAENPPQRSDLSGIWQLDQISPTNHDFRPMKLFIEQFDDELVGINMERQSFLPPGIPFMKGPDPSRLDFQLFNTRGIVQWLSGSIKIGDSDHFSIEGLNQNFKRIEPKSGGEVACSGANASAMTNEELLARAWIYLNRKDNGTATCWYRIGAERGDAEAEVDYASSLLFGQGVAKDRAEGLAWAQKSAIQGTWAGATDLAYAFRTGDGFPKSEQRAKYWETRAELLDPHVVHRKDFLPIPAWALDTAGPCDPANLPHASDATSFAAGRVAYEARSLTQAACWFQASANHGNVRALVYLGILFEFGLGVERDQAIGIGYMKKAAGANDAFAMMYLANFYRYGIGVKQDANEAYSLLQKAMRAPYGPDAYLRVQGLLLNDQEIVKMAASGLSAISDESTCEDLNARSKTNTINPQVRNCTQTQDWLTNSMTRHQNHTVEQVEEIFPELFTPAVPADYQMLKQAAKLGLTR